MTYKYIDDKGLEVTIDAEAIGRLVADGSIREATMVYAVGRWARASEMELFQAAMGAAGSVMGSRPTQSQSAQPSGSHASNPLESSESVRPEESDTHEGYATYPADTPSLLTGPGNSWMRIVGLGLLFVLSVGTIASDPDGTIVLLVIAAGIGISLAFYWRSCSRLSEAPRWQQVWLRSIVGSVVAFAVAVAIFNPGDSSTIGFAIGYGASSGVLFGGALALLARHRWGPSGRDDQL